MPPNAIRRSSIMAILPGWDSLDNATKWASALHIAGYVALGLLFVFEVLAFVYDHRRDNLLVIQQTGIEQQRAAERQQEQQRSQAVIKELEDRLNNSRASIDQLQQERAPRILTDAQVASLSAVLSAHQPAAITIKASINAQDARHYSEQLASVLRK